MLITRKHLSRRTLLRGAGVSLALPFLDSMVPAQTPISKTAANPRPRLCCIEMVHGSAGSTADGSNKHYWSPEKEGSDFELTQTLEPLAPYRDYLTVISDTDLHPAGAYADAEEGGDHFRSSSVFLTAAHPKLTMGADIYCGISIDQMYAQQFGQDTPLPSVQLCIESVDSSGHCDYGYACVYSDTISWASPTQPLPMTIDPRQAFELLFGDGSTRKSAHCASRPRAAFWIASRTASVCCSAIWARPTAAGSTNFWTTSAKSNGASNALSSTIAAWTCAPCRPPRWEFRIHLKST